MAHGLPTIVNAHGSSSELPEDVVVKLPDRFDDQHLVTALEQLYENPGLRAGYGSAGQQYALRAHSVEYVAAKYYEAMEQFAEEHPMACEKRTRSRLASNDSILNMSEEDLRYLASAVAAHRQPMGRQRLLLDASGTARIDLKTGIQRVAKQILTALIENPPAQARPETVHDLSGTYTYGRPFTLSMLKLEPVLADDECRLQPGDIWLGLDIFPLRKEHFEQLRARNIPIYFVVYDLLPVLRPEFFPANASTWFRPWLDTICECADGLICISRSVADELCAWLEQVPPKRLRPLKIGYFHLGADIPTSPSTSNIEAAEIVKAGDRPSLLMVGTVEPRKGHRQALDAFELLWAQDVPVNLVIVGKPGWEVEALIERIKNHKQLGKRLFWIAQADDDVLTTMYREAAGLLAASEGEGFGLPLMEAARHGLPIIARDIPVFREVAGEHAYYFDGTSPQSLAQAIRSWVNLRASGQVTASTGIGWLTWTQSAEQLMRVVMGGAYYREWLPDTKGAGKCGPAK